MVWIWWCWVAGVARSELKWRVRNGDVWLLVFILGGVSQTSDDEWLFGAGRIRKGRWGGEYLISNGDTALQIWGLMEGLWPLDENGPMEEGIRKQGLQWVDHLCLAMEKER